MLRFRRYRVFVICAAVVLFLLFRVSRNSDWESGASSVYREYVGPYAKSGHKSPAENGKTDRTKHRPHDHSSDDDDHYRPQAKEKTKQGPNMLATPTPIRAGDVEVMPPIQTPRPPEAIPDREQTHNHDMYKGANDELHIQKPPGAEEEPTVYVTSTIHWQGMPENYPVPEESVIMLPTEAPKPIPRVQYDFPPESGAEKKKREKRLAHVKGEMKKAWGGYRKYAWGHDELSPVSKKYRDPFCGWAATLVDALDTLWIMGMEEEFDHAYTAVKQIDFTTSAYRTEIPVFETIIRYLGGLIAAYDVTGGKEGKYPALLTKAVELAEILMGVFDTPNRMPILYYNWKPAYASQPQRASSSVSVAELGSMSMEFTRLAQLTGKHKYYDAVARITDAFEEWQKRGTALPGIFPQQIDASGCNRTAQSLNSVAASSDAVQEQAAQGELPEPEGYKPDGTETKTENKLKKKEEPDLEFQVTPGSRRDEPGTGEFHKITKRGATSADDLPVHHPAYPANLGSDADQANTYSATGLYTDWDCVPQFLTSGGYGQDEYSMGGSQDSAYEYFPKQYALLGGVVPKYREMHIKVIEATKKYLLYRPMIKDESRSILFSSKVRSRDGTDKDLTYEYEITHLTCFLGGMFGLGGKLFDRPGDVEIGKRLADGCAWAYEVMPSGIMPEGSMIFPCESATDCKWNQTLWHQKLDVNWRSRESTMADYHLRMKEWKEKKVTMLKEHKEMELRRQEALEEEKRMRPANVAKATEETGPTKLTANDFEYRNGQAYPKEQSSSINKREASGSKDSMAAAIDVKEHALEGEFDLDSRDSGEAYGGQRGTESAYQAPLMEPIYPPEPMKPLTHQEYVDKRIKDEELIEGFSSLNDRRYLLRPEAIESVWYMYRITGDVSWQEKGWRMYEAVIKAASTPVGHSAVDEVTSKEGTSQRDEMESFWLAETLKYFYLLFTPPDVISLDEYVFNTEAHPFKRPK